MKNDPVRNIPKDISLTFVDAKMRFNSAIGSEKGQYITQIRYPAAGFGVQPIDQYLERLSQFIIPVLFAWKTLS